LLRLTHDAEAETGAAEQSLLATLAAVLVVLAELVEV